MSATYVAWNGQSYPWPPPEGWYEAKDGRWWAPGSGPNPLQAPGPYTPEPAEISDIEPSEQPSTDQETILNRSQHDARTSNPGSVGAANLGELPRTTAPATPQHSKTDADASSTPGTSGIWSPPSEEASTKNRNRPLMIGAAALAAFVAVGLGVFALLGGSDSRDEITAGSSTTAVTTETSLATGSEQAGSLSVEDTEQPAGSATESTALDTTTGTTGTTSTIPATTTTTSTSTSASATTRVGAGNGSATMTEAQMVGAFRSFLDDNGLSGELLSDGDLASFGDAFCVVAAVSDSYENYISLRTEAIADSNQELADGEIETAVDGAIKVFCPDTAKRLGLD